MNADLPRERCLPRGCGDAFPGSGNPFANKDYEILNEVQVREDRRAQGER